MTHTHTQDVTQAVCLCPDLLSEFPWLNLSHALSFLFHELQHKRPSINNNQPSHTHTHTLSVNIHVHTHTHVLLLYMSNLSLWLCCSLMLLMFFLISRPDKSQWIIQAAFMSLNNFYIHVLHCGYFNIQGAQGVPVTENAQKYNVH